MSSLFPTVHHPSSGTLMSQSTVSDSSRTDSNRSTSSAGDVDFVDRDYTKDNVVSPIDMECQIQAERITKILDQAIYKTKLALCLPQLVQEYKTLHSQLSADHMQDLQFIFEQYDNPLVNSCTSLLNTSALEDINNGDLSLENRLNPELGHLIYIMNSYPGLKPKVTEFVATMKLHYKKGANKQQGNLEYLLALEQFRDLVSQELNSTAEDQLLAKFNTRKMEATNEKLVVKIKEYTQTLKEDRERFEEKMAEKKKIITKLEHDIANFNMDSNMKLKKQILDADRQMVLATRSHVVRYEMLKEEAEERKQTYDDMLHKHILDEQKQRLARCKVETQILSWLQKYDLEMGEKQSELDEITENYEDEIKKIEELQEKLAEQDKEYVPLMAEREAEYQQEMAEKMTKFLMEHAARVIQNFWRQILENRAEKKKLKKMVKQQQMAMEAAQIAAQKSAAALAATARKAAKAAQ